MTFRSALLAVCFSSFIYSGHPITIDGLFHDWDNVPIAYSDPQSDGMSTDFADLKVTYDNEFLFIYFSIHAGEVLLQSDNALHLYIDADSDSTTGHYYYGLGAELHWEFGQRSGTHYVADGIIPVEHRDITFRSSPTITSQEFEICIERDSYALQSENSEELVEGRIILAESPPNSDVLPNEPGGVPFYIGEDLIAEPTPISFEKRHEDDIRLVSHNVWSSAMMDDDYQEYFQRIYQALDPDIVCLQEMYENTNQLQSLFNSWFPNTQWYVSNQFRDNIIVSKYPVLAQNYMTSSERTMVAQLNTEDDLGYDLLIFNSHLSCCDNDDSRQYDSDEFVSNWRDWRENQNGPFTLEENTPFVHVGDFNLVGDSQQLMTLTEGDIDDENSFGNDYALDWDGTPITDLFSRHSHKRMGYTWRYDYSSYSPGKLDYILYSDSMLDTSKHFVFNTLTMDSASLAFYGLEEMDSYNSSDHSPRVLDLRQLYINEVNDENLPLHIQIGHPYPNPFNPNTEVKIELTSPSVVTIELMDIQGRYVRTVLNEPLSSGDHRVIVQGDGLANGIYILVVRSEHIQRSFKVALIK